MDDKERIKRLREELQETGEALADYLWSYGGGVIFSIDETNSTVTLAEKLGEVLRKRLKPEPMGETGRSRFQLLEVD